MKKKQYADLKYDLNDYLKLLKATKNQEVDLVFGVRVGNCFASFLLNILFGVKLSG